METILLLVHTESDGSLPKSALEALNGAMTLAEGLGGALVIGLLGGEIQAAADRLAGAGATRILGVSGPDFSQPRYASDAAAAEAIVRAAAATIVVVPGTSRFNRVMAGVTERLGGRIDTHVTGLAVENGAPLLRRWFYRQRMEAAFQRTLRPWVISTDPGSLDAWQGDAGTARVEALMVALPESGRRTTVTGIRAPQAGEQTIRPDAKVLFVAGAGWTKTQPDGKVHLEDAANLIKGFLNKTQASLGSSKSLVDLSGTGQAVLPFLTHLNQVGQTGATPRHPKGLSTCCHGEEPHVVGWRFVNERRAVNLDPNCGWAHGKADVLYVADAFEVIKKVNELLEK
jgi:electron transfer flavoprotein alpha subunit